MPLTSPYGSLNAANGSIVIAYISHEDKHLLTSFAGRGILQLAVQNLLHNLAQDIRTLNGTDPITHRPDAFDIVGILVEHRGVDLNLANRLIGTSVGRSAVISFVGGRPLPLVRPRESKRVRREATTGTAIPSNPQGDAERRVGRDRKATGNKGKNPRGKGKGNVGEADV